MNFKWYIGAFLGLISIFVVQQQETVVHNQEIVLHFNSERISAEDEQHSISLLTHQLIEAGAVSITSVALEDGSYKISYHSKLDVASIKEQLDIAEFQNFLASQQPFDQLPFEEKTSVYQMDMYDLQQDTSGVADTDQALLFDIKQNINRGSQVDYPIVFKNVTVQLDGLLLRTVQGTNHRLGLRITDQSYAIPAVRAGPLA